MDSPSKPNPPAAGLVSLAYAGNERSLLEVAPSHLRNAGLRATFFLESVLLLDNLAALKRLSEDGHEMGSACFFGSDDGEGNLPAWTLEMVEGELAAAVKLLSESFPGQADFPFAYPGRDCRCLTSSFDPQPTTYRRVVEQVHSVALTARQGLNRLEDCVTADLAVVSAEEMDATSLIQIADRALSQGSWAILVFEGVGAGRHSVDSYAHQALCRHLEPKGAQVQPVLRAAYGIRQRREAEWQRMRAQQR
ncbi:MAG: hypothetical protein HZC36_11010 [Armatimonadetes bacterium]|nr:hypothetical protein [Armatimonadota bacterium]